MPNFRKLLVWFDKVLALAVRWRLWLFVPLIVLAIDFAVSPFVYHTKFHTQAPQIEGLIEQSPVYLGRYKGHEIFVSFDDLSNDDALEVFPHDVKHRLGLVIGHYLTHQGVASQPGATGRSVHNLLKRRSSRLGERFQDFLKETANSPPGTALTFSVDEGQEGACQECKIQNVFVILVQPIYDQETVKEEMSRGLQQAFASADQLQLGSLLVTTISLDPRYDRSILPEDFFNVLFGSIEQGNYPQRIYLGFYKRWPNDFVKKITTALNRVWHEEAAGDSDFSVGLYRFDFRLSLVLLSLCLLVCSTKTSLSLKNAIIISGAYLGIVLGGFPIFKPFLSGFGPDIELVAMVVVQLVLAVGFPYIVQWDPRGLFSRKVGGG